MTSNSLFLTTLFSACLFFACSNASSNTNSGKDSATLGSLSTRSQASSDKGTIICTIDGKSRTFQVHNAFFEMRLEPDMNGPKDGFELLDGNKKKEGFQFEIKNKVTSVFKGMDGVLNMLSYFNSNGADYVPADHGDAIVTVSSFDTNHLTGTFSGKFQNTDYKGASDPNPEFIRITNGKFDLHK